MTQIENLKAKIPSMDAKAKSRLRQNASSILSRNPGDANAREILEFLNAEEATQPRGDRYDVTGLLSWETYRSDQSVFRAFHEDDVVGRIFMRGMQESAFSLRVRTGLNHDHTNDLSASSPTSGP